MVAALVTSLLVLGLASTGTTTKFLAGSGLVLMLASVAAVGLLVAWHQPGNPIGWLLLVDHLGNTAGLVRQALHSQPLDV